MTGLREQQRANRDLKILAFWKLFAKDRTAVAGAIIIAAVSLAALLAPLLAPYDPNFQFLDGVSPEGSPLPPSARFWLGSDTNGRDQLSRLLYGAQTSLIIGLLANGAAVVIGTLLGVVAGSTKGLLSALIMRFTDLMMAFPALLLAIALAAILKPSLYIVALVIALVNWVQIARVIYTETRALAERDFIEAAHRRQQLAHSQPTSVAASGADHSGLWHAWHCDDGAAGSLAVVPGRWRAAPDAILGQDDL